ncbi:MAG: CRISPR-associated protein Csx20 [Desulfobacteraceae bacterium]
MNKIQIRKLFLIFNHEITEKQLMEAEKDLGVTAIIEMPRELKEIWKQIPAEDEHIAGYLEPVKKWVLSHAGKKDFILIQGDFGATYLMVDFAFSHGLIPVYSTTARQAAEFRQPDGSLKTEHVFQHRIFRKYGC